MHFSVNVVSSCRSTRADKRGPSFESRKLQHQGCFRVGRPLQSDVQTVLISSRRRSSVNHHCSSAATSSSCAAASDAVPVTNRDPGRDVAAEEIAVVAHHSTVPSYSETPFCSRSRVGRLVEYQPNGDHPRERAMLRAGHEGAEGCTPASGGVTPGHRSGRSRPHLGRPPAKPTPIAPLGAAVRCNGWLCRDGRRRLCHGVGLDTPEGLPARGLGWLRGEPLFTMRGVPSLRRRHFIPSYRA